MAQAAAACALRVRFRGAAAGARARGAGKIGPGVVGAPCPDAVRATDTGSDLHSDASGLAQLKTKASSKAGSTVSRGKKSGT